MIDWLRDRFGGDRLAPEDEAELAWVEARVAAAGAAEDSPLAAGSAATDAPAARAAAGGSGTSATVPGRDAASADADLADLAATVGALNSLGAASAPRSFALTRETLIGAGYTERESERILAPAGGRGGFWRRPVVQQSPLVLTALALLVGGIFVLNLGDESALDLDVGTPDSAESSEPMAAMRVAVEVPDAARDAAVSDVEEIAASPEIGQFAVESLEHDDTVMTTGVDDSEQPEGAAATDGTGMRRMLREPSDAEEVTDGSAVDTEPRALRQQDTGSEDSTLTDAAATTSVAASTATWVDWLVPAALLSLALFGLIAWLALLRWRRSWS